MLLFFSYPKTKTKANPLNVPRPSLDILGEPRILFAAAPLIVPMTLRLSSLSLRAIVVLVVSRQKGITLVFKNDPLESVNVSSSFDGVESVAGYIQREIEGQLREAFRSDLPGVIHRLSQKWLSGEVKSAAEEVNQVASKRGRDIQGFEKDAKIETRTSYTTLAGGKIGRGLTVQMDGRSVGGDSGSIGSDGDNYSNFDGSTRSSSHQQRKIATPQFREDTLQSVPESIESYDPTYGLRPNVTPIHGRFGEYERLVRTGTEGRGLGDVLESSGSDDEGEDYLFGREFAGPDDSFETKDYESHRYDDYRRKSTNSTGVLSWGDPRLDPRYDFETISAVGGGTITRPRIFHTQSQMRPQASTSGSLSAHGSPSTATVGAGQRGRREDSRSASSTLAAIARRSSSYSSITPNIMDGRQDYFDGLTASRNQSFAGIYGRNNSVGFTSSAPQTRTHSVDYQHRGLRSQPSHSASSSHYNQTASSSSLFPPPPTYRNSSYSSPASSTIPSPIVSARVFPPPRPDPIDLLSRSPSSVLDTSFDEDLGLPITLNPAKNDACAHLATLTDSNQTLSPFTRSYEHFTARSSPHVISRASNDGGRGGRGFVSLTTRLGGGGSNLVGGDLPGVNENSYGPIKAKRKRIHRIGQAKIAPNILNGLESLGIDSTAGGSNGSGSIDNFNRRVSSSFSPVIGRSSAPSEISDYFPSSPLPFRLRKLSGI